MMVEVLATVAFGTVGAACLLSWLCPEHPQTKFMRECREAGMSHEETQAAMSIRVAFVRLRRLASDECVAKEGKYERKHIDEHAGQIAAGLASIHGAEAAKSFIGWVNSCPDSEILYDDARAARSKAHEAILARAGLWPPKKTVTIDPDLRDAFKIVR